MHAVPMKASMGQYMKDGWLAILKLDTDLSPIGLTPHTTSLRYWQIQDFWLCQTFAQDSH